MALLKSLYALQVFVTIYILIKNVRGENEEITKCLKQITSKFGNGQAAIDCLKYAIEHYIDGKCTIISSQNDPSVNNVLENFDNVSSSTLYDQSFYGYSNEQDGTIQLDDKHDEPLLDEDLLLYVDNFYGLKDFIEKDLKEKQISDEQLSNPYEDAKQFHTALETTDDGIDYATKYHDALYNMIRGKGVPKREVFCYHHFLPELENPKECMSALEEFGNTAISAVRWAFIRYTLKECQFLGQYYVKYEYITIYMGVILKLIQPNHITKSPLRYCEDTVKKMYENGLL